MMLSRTPSSMQPGFGGPHPGLRSRSVGYQAYPSGGPPHGGNPFGSKPPPPSAVGQRGQLARYSLTHQSAVMGGGRPIHGQAPQSAMNVNKRQPVYLPQGGMFSGPGRQTFDNFASSRPFNGPMVVPHGSPTRGSGQRQPLRAAHHQPGAHPVAPASGVPASSQGAPAVTKTAPPANNNASAQPARQPQPQAQPVQQQQPPQQQPPQQQQPQAQQAPQQQQPPQQQQQQPPQQQQQQHVTVTRTQPPQQRGQPGPFPNSPVRSGAPGQPLAPAQNGVTRSLSSRYGQPPQGYGAQRPSLGRQSLPMNAFVGSPQQNSMRTLSSTHSIAHAGGNQPSNVAGKKMSSVVDVGYSEDPNLDHCDYMEDESVIIDCFMNNPNRGYFAVFDGHGGSEAVEFAVANLHHYLGEEIMRGLDLQTALRAAFWQCDQAMRNFGIGLDCGCTALVCLFEREPQTSNETVIIANAGDTRAVLCRKGKAVRVSKDHTATDAAEAHRVWSSGGYIEDKRVSGITQTSRGLGDHDVQHLIPDPDVNPLVLEPNDEFLILATDGVWDVMDDQFAVDLVRFIPNVQDMAQTIVRTALELGTDDNTSCMVINL